MSGVAMRRPTRPLDAWSDWRRVLDGERLPVLPTVPMPGLWALRRDGLRRAVRIDLVSVVCADTGELVHPETWTALVSGHPVPVGHVWPACARHPVTASEYAALLRLTGVTVGRSGPIDIAREVIAP